MKHFAPVLATLWLLAPAVALRAATDALEADFLNPPEATKPRCYWYWMDGHITKDGITKDLEAMRRIGIGEGYIGAISGQSGMPANPNPKALTNEWWSYIEHAVREGGRLGVDIGLFNSPGWSQSGGPWVKPRQAMRYVTLPELRLRGPQQFAGKLPVPTGEFQDLAVLAFPVPAGESEEAKETARTPTAVTFEMPAPFTARSLTVQPAAAINVTAELLASDNGSEFRPVKKFTIERRNLGVEVGPLPLAPVVAAFPATTARFFRLTFSGACNPGEVQLSAAARVESYAEKSLLKMFQDPLPPFDFYTWPQQPEPDIPAIPPNAVHDLTKLMTADGTLHWNVPPGDWIILRTALTPTGRQNAPAPAEATGLEVDKMSREALQAHFDAYIGHLLKAMPAADRTALKHVVADSYEVGSENWTDGFAADFQQRYGYNPLPWLPVMTGRIIGNADMSDRFLWDLRRMVADRIARDYVGGLRDLCNRNGLRMWLENYGHWGFCGEFLNYGGACDEIGGEFWESGSLGTVELRDASSAAHTYGKPVVWAEAFTGGPAFRNTPRELKARGDWAFCEGINQFVLHVNIHQPWDDKLPGINAGFGTEFNRNNTWFEDAKPWVDYLRRCSVMLQRGNAVADVAYFISEDAPKMAGTRKPPLPAGYDFDYINAEVIENRLAVRDGRFVLPDGMSYRLLVLPESKTMRPALLGKIMSLVAAGGAVAGPAPERSPSLAGYPASDTEVKKLAGELWGSGKVLTGTNLSDIFGKLQLPPDVAGPADILWKHRKQGDTDIYFLSNQLAEARTAMLSFRVAGRQPELWWPETGRLEPAPDFTLTDGRVRMPVAFDAGTSVFVVFRKPAFAAKTSAKRLPAPFEIRRAVYEAIDGAGSMDVTDLLAEAVRCGCSPLTAGFELFGRDPAVQHLKQLRIDYIRDGKPGVMVVPENGRLQLPNRDEILDPGSFEIRRATYEAIDGAGSLDVTAKLAEELRSKRFPIIVGIELFKEDPAFGHLKQVRIEYLHHGKPGVMLVQEHTSMRLPQGQPITGPWTVTFPHRTVIFERLLSWPQHHDPAIRYFSGAASYRTTFEVPEIVPGTLLDLGTVDAIAKVAVNGKELGTLWKQPYRLDLSAALKPGLNELSVTVVNPWNNRLVGDAQPGATGRTTFLSSQTITAATPLLPAGLLGPVTLQPPDLP